MVCRTKYKPWKMIVQMYQSRLFQMWRCWIYFKIHSPPTRDPRTRTDWSRTKRFGPVLGPDRTRTKNFWEIQDRTGPGPNILRNPGPTRTRTRKFWEIQDQPGPRPENFGTSRTDSDQDQVDFRKPGSIRTGTKYAFHQYAENSPSPYSQSKVDGLLMNSSGSFICGIHSNIFGSYDAVHRLKIFTL